MVKIFSMFPRAASASVVVLRLSVAAAFNLDVLGHFLPPTPGWYSVTRWLCSAALVVGIFTPLAAVFAALFALSELFDSGGGSLWPAVAAVNAVALSLLGPGDYSLDARLFGRRRFVMTARREPAPSEPPP